MAGIELSIPATAQKDRGLWEQECARADKQWRNGATNRLVEAQHTVCLTTLTSKPCVADVN